MKTRMNMPLIAIAKEDTETLDVLLSQMNQMLAKRGCISGTVLQPPSYPTASEAMDVNPDAVSHAITAYTVTLMQDANAKEYFVVLGNVKTTGPNSDMAEELLYTGHITMRCTVRHIRDNQCTIRELIAYDLTLTLDKAIVLHNDEYGSNTVALFDSGNFIRIVEE